MKRTPWAITREMFLSTDEVAMLVNHVRSRAEVGRGRRLLSASLDRLIIEAMLFSGLRNSEFCRLTLADAPQVEGPSAFRVQSSRGEERTVHVPAAIGRLVADYIARYRPQCLPDAVDPRDPNRPLIFHERRGPYERTGLYRRVVRVLTNAGLGERASVQLLRHTYGYLAYLRTGGNLLFVQRQLGHANPIITSIYSRFVPESYAALAERLEQTD